MFIKYCHLTISRRLACSYFFFWQKRQKNKRKDRKILARNIVFDLRFFCSSFVIREDTQLMGRRVDAARRHCCCRDGEASHGWEVAVAPCPRWDACTFFICICTGIPCRFPRWEHTLFVWLYAYEQVDREYMFYKLLVLQGGWFGNRNTTSM